MYEAMNAATPTDPAPAGSGRHISVIVPTYREAGNLRPLTTRISAALDAAGLDHEIIIVDDNSQDGTEEVCRELIAAGTKLRLLVRRDQRGLATAVMHGFDHGRGQILVCMDADLSHPPEAIPELVAAIASDSADFVIGSRYVPGGTTDQAWSACRWLNSRVATLLARPLTRARDPMAGFFALRRETYAQAAPLDPVGYKIGLELLVKCRCRRVLEIPIHFALRRVGESKLNLREQLRYLRHLARLMRFKLNERRRAPER